MFDNVMCLRCLDAGGVPRNLHHAQDLQQTEHLLQLLLPGAGGGVGILNVDINTVTNTCYSENTGAPSPCFSL